MADTVAGRPQGKGWVSLLAALSAIVLVQLFYWFVVIPFLYDANPTPDKLPVSNAQVAILASPDMAAMAAARFKPVDLPWDGCCEAGYRGIRMEFTLPKVPADGLAISRC
jgi:hypothetical protein